MTCKGIVFFDYDGTLCDEACGIFTPTEATCKAIKRLQENGYAVSIATGRARCYIPPSDIRFDAYVTSNGAHASLGDEAVHNIYMDKALVSEIMAELDKMGLYYSLETQDFCYAKDLYEPTFYGLLTKFRIDTGVFLPLSEHRDIVTHKFLLSFQKQQDFEYLKDKFGERAVFTQHRDSYSADIDAPNINKAVGCRALIERLNPPKGSVYAFGDGDNDYDMLMLADHAVAMGKHAARLNECAEYTTATVAEEGVLKALKHFNLI